MIKINETFGKARIVLWVIIVLSLTTMSYSQVEFAITQPVNYEYKLSGNFGEFRSSHLHAGLDIKPSSYGANDPIFSIADGYITRIVVSRGGYGQAIYINHPSLGITSVYAHLKQFESSIQYFVQTEQIKLENFEIDLVVPKEIFPVSKGQYIAIMGNEGHSYGTHLHFETRDMFTDEAINPMIFGFGTQDKIRPIISAISVHGFDQNLNKISTKHIPLINKKSQVIHINEPITIGGLFAGIAVESIDKMNNSHNTHGVYQISLTIEGDEAYRMCFDKFSFSESYQVEGMKDFPSGVKMYQNHVLCYTHPESDFQFIHKNENSLFKIYVEEPRQFELAVSDYENNTTIVKGRIVRNHEVEDTNIVIKKERFLENDQTLYKSESGATIEITSESFFKAEELTIGSITILGKKTFTILEKTALINKPIKLVIDLDSMGIAKEDYSKASIYRTFKNGSKQNLGGIITQNQITTYISDPGEYSVMMDTIPPKIVPINFSTNAKKRQHFTFIVKEDIPVSGKTINDVQYKVWIDDTFVISALRKMTNTLTIPLSQLEKGNHSLKIEAVDHIGNRSQFVSNFIK